MRRKNNKQNPPAAPKPQVWITLMWHMGLRLPWTWRLGPSNASERGDVVLKENMTVLSWPESVRAAGLPALKLRLVKVRVGKTWMWMLTSVLDKDQLSVKTIRELYKQRWGIEVSQADCTSSAGLYQLAL